MLIALGILSCNKNQDNVNFQINIYTTTDVKLSYKVGDYDFSKTLSSNDIIKITPKYLSKYKIELEPLELSKYHAINIVYLNKDGNTINKTIATTKSTFIILEGKIE